MSTNFCPYKPLCQEICTSAQRWGVIVCVCERERAITCPDGMSREILAIINKPIYPERHPGAIWGIHMILKRFRA